MSEKGPIYFGWFDNAKKPLIERVALGAAAFKTRRGYKPSVCLLNQAQAESNGLPPRVGCVAVALRSNILPNHFYFL